MIKVSHHITTGVHSGGTKRYIIAQVRLEPPRKFAPARPIYITVRLWGKTAGPLSCKVQEDDANFSIAHRLFGEKQRGDSYRFNAPPAYGEYGYSSEEAVIGARGVRELLRNTGYFNEDSIDQVLKIAQISDGFEVEDDDEDHLARLAAQREAERVAREKEEAERAANPVWGCW